MAKKEFQITRGTQHFFVKSASFWARKKTKKQGVLGK
jgi:hypothetical protein